MRNNNMEPVWRNVLCKWAKVVELTAKTCAMRKRMPIATIYIISAMQAAMKLGLMDACLHTFRA